MRVRELEMEDEKLREDRERAESILAEGSAETERLFGLLESVGGRSEGGIGSLRRCTHASRRWSGRVREVPNRRAGGRG